ncbi:MAG: transglutaminase domain-containing protein [Dehalococcoidia bacterium]|nr:transglutaminase domain-containing protein [Dehalococcoidia bacterium]
MTFNRNTYLQPSELCDFDTSNEIKCEVLKLTGNCGNRQARFERIFAFVKELPYGFEDWDLKASDVLKKGWGMCSGKTNLLVAMLRSVGIPSRYRVYRIRADSLLWSRMGSASGLPGRLKELGDERDHVDCEVWLGHWIVCDPGRDSAMEKGILKMGGNLKRRVVTDEKGREKYLRLAVIDQWARQRQSRRAFRGGRADVFAEINRQLDQLRKFGSTI